ncbi:hypothetical protein CROQUDRAFT_134213 [Cronartium quercuum f. sp. fusiforme G11]|uniref:Uncharacterized protein n=1 Tax=Cronartium quercuum f. sp. fusiforme G11 TaxID=708437 RepID=A0A9P6NJK7_9BASI|nr:hypothetical protein CROQUDRAFT_134213 [Cronartium quercuum f. sp. fusiforme G11]
MSPTESPEHVTEKIHENKSYNCNCDKKIEQVVNSFAYNPVNQLEKLLVPLCKNIESLSEKILNELQDTKMDKIIDINNTMEAKLQPLRTLIQQLHNKIITEIRHIKILPQKQDHEEGDAEESHLGTQRLVAASGEELLNKQLHFEDQLEKRLDGMEEAITRNMSQNNILENKLDSIKILLQQMNEQGVQDRQTMLNNIQQVKIQRSPSIPQNLTTPIKQVPSNKDNNIESEKKNMNEIEKVQTNSPHQEREQSHLSQIFQQPPSDKLYNTEGDQKNEISKTEDKEDNASSSRHGNAR